MRLNEHTVITGKSVILTPYVSEHVEQYHKWMQDPFLQEMTASEPLSIEEEYDNQKSWREDDEKLTFIILDRESESMIGDVNLFITENEDSAEVWNGEVEIMIAEESARRKGVATEAIRLFMHYVCEHLPRVQLFFVKIGDSNESSLKLFEKLDFRFHKHVEVFSETELRQSVTGALTNSLKEHWADYSATLINKPP
ncbi:hypothetical protein CYMTET_38772 [Cymbomonas tetramitiformis]|uniref:N-acetyltransferase domain-containing protein n=1 Tax=Cymbomonas tetramitiformis TaxID=36881 RepID=A0AAE0CBC2_9CHLO|nr:hypothetical protein CYMTET_38772 [Cymbomonas tetramitiformis]|eukprot:gene1579-2216_t